MQKPITMIRQELIEKLVEDVNSSGLPFFIMIPILQDLLESVKKGAEVQAEKDRAEYERYLREATAQRAQDNAVPSEGNDTDVSAAEG